MNEQRAMEWADALESGEYPQAQGGLRSKRGFCCLGVACNMHAQTHPEIAEQQDSHLYYMGQSSFPPLEVCDWMGMYSRKGGRKDLAAVLINGNRYLNLADANDEGVTFKDIAKYIRENWREL